MSRKEIAEATAVALVLCGGAAEWEARFVFKVLEELERPEEGASTGDPDPA